MRRVARPTRGALVLVGGHSRGVGKTLTIEHLLRARPGGPWVAVKVSAHRHAAPDTAAPLIDEDTTPAAWTQTGRYLRAGAARAFLVRAPEPQLASAARFVERLARGGQNVVIESNRLARWLNADRVIFVIAPPIDDWKASSQVAMARADALVTLARFGPAPAYDAEPMACRPVFCLGQPADDRRFARWLHRAFDPDSRASCPAPETTYVGSTPIA